MQPFIIVLKRKTLPIKILPLLCHTDEMYISEHELLLWNDVSINPTSHPQPRHLLASIMITKLCLAPCVAR